MTALDIIVLFLIGAGAVFGFMRGFVQEALSLIAWVLMIAAVRLLHDPFTQWLAGPVGTHGGAAVLAFLILVGVSWLAGRFIARAMGRSARKSVLGPIDRVLGFGFGAIKGLIGATFLFMGMLLVVQTLAGSRVVRPTWMTTSRTYRLLDASANAISAFIAHRRGSDAPATGPEPGATQPPAGAGAL